MTTSGPSPDDRLVGQLVASTFGGLRQATRYYDEEETSSIVIVRCLDAPEPGQASISTVGLHRFANLLDEQDVRVELAALTRASDVQMSNVLATAAFFVAKHTWLAAPGVIFPDILSSYDLDTSMRHVVWTGPFPWPALGSASIRNGLIVHWLIAVPIYDSERDMIEAKGFPTFERLMELSKVEVDDLRRGPIL